MTIIRYYSDSGFIREEIIYDNVLEQLFYENQEEEWSFGVS